MRLEICPFLWYRFFNINFKKEENMTEVKAESFQLGLTPEQQAELDAVELSSEEERAIIRAARTGSLVIDGESQTVVLGGEPVARWQAPPLEIIKMEKDT
jgi:hypothetical protein